MVRQDQREGEAYEMKTLALSAILLLSSCYDSARVREIGTQGAIIHSAPPPERGRIGSAWDTIQARALFGVGLANKNGRI